MHIIIYTCIYIYGHRPPQALHFVGPKGDKHIYTYQCNMKRWQNHGKTDKKCMMSVPSSQSCVAIILGWFFFLSAEIRPKNGNKHPTIHLSTRILGFKSKRWSLGFLRVVQPKIQKSKNPSFQTESLDSGQKDGFLDFLGFFFWFFWILRKGVWIFGFPSQKSKKTRGKRWIFQKKKQTKENDGFLQKSKKKNLGKRWIFPILISKIKKKTKEKDWFLQKSKKNQEKDGLFQSWYQKSKKLKEKDGFFQKNPKKCR